MLNSNERMDYICGYLASYENKIKMANKQEKNQNKGLIALLVCGVLAMALIIGCVFFRDQFFGLFFQ